MTIRYILNRHGLVPAPVRAGSLGWRHLMNHYKNQILACDFLTVETRFLKTIYIFFFIEIGTRRILIAGISDHPNGHWVAQQARNYGWLLQERDTDFVCLIRDNDSKYTNSFDIVRSMTIRYTHLILHHARILLK